MNIPRRQFLGRMAGLGVGAAAGILLTGCESLEQRFTKPVLSADALPPPGIDPSPTVRLLNRVAYGPRPGDIAHVETVGMIAYVEEQLDPERIIEPEILTWRLRSLQDDLSDDAGVLFDEDDHLLVRTLRQATNLSAVYSNRQLYERMVEFWNDHFNVYAFKGEGPQLKVMDDHDTIRKHAMGKFRDLLGASARSAAMLGYLDNTSNEKGVPNENYARELMELHTLGVHGGYTQHDVQEVARCLTGWTSARHWHRGQFSFDVTRHDNGSKTVLGHLIPAGGGISDGERVLDIVAAHPSTARHLSRKICVHFLGTAPDAWVTRLSQVYLNTGGDIKAVLRPLLTSSDLLTSAPILKRPFDLTVSSLRALNADTDGGADVQQHLDAMGQPLFGWPMPNGFPEEAHTWIGALIPRWNFGLALASSNMKNTSVDFDALTASGRKQNLSKHDTLLELVFGERAHHPGLADLRHAQSAHPDIREYASLLLLSPAFQWR